MKSITYGEHSWLLGDEAADTLLEYAVVLARRGTADAVEMRAVDAEGRDQRVRFLIGPATMMTSEPSTSPLDEPENADTIAMIRERIDATTVVAHDSEPVADGEYFDEF
ncbi:hypothetical protein BH11ACT3_BH11ACT3_19790 [soil metagenome]